MKISRRNFMAIGGAAVLGGASIATSPATFAQNSRAGNFDLLGDGLSDRLFYLTSADFKRQVGSEFILATAEGTTPVRLLNVTETVPARSTRRRPVAETFSLSFETPTPFTQETYHLYHARLGELDLLLVPEAGNEFILHAVINRIVG